MSRNLLYLLPVVLFACPSPDWRTAHTHCPCVDGWVCQDGWCVAGDIHTATDTDSDTDTVTVTDTVMDTVPVTDTEMDVDADTDPGPVLPIDILQPDTVPDVTLETTADTVMDTVPDPGHSDVCQPKTCQELNWECGQDDDGCGKPLDCGTCGEHQACQDHKCVVATWTDPVTKLMWQVQAQDKIFTWQQAMDYCANLDLGGYSDWRLPTISELRSLIRGCDKTITGGACGVTDDCLKSSCRNDSCNGCDYDKGPANGCYWPDGMQGHCGWYWSSSSVAGDSYCAWGVHFVYGVVFSFDGDHHSHARCVRLGP